MDGVIDRAAGARPRAAPPPQRLQPAPTDREALAFGQPPTPLTSFIGREREVAALARLLTEGPTGPRLLTLIGVGGIGKTRLALAAANAAAAAYPDGIAWVELAALADPALVPGAVAAALAVPEEPGRPPIEALVARLRDRALVLVLDNCDHLAAACAALAHDLLRVCPHPRLLVTSRVPLQVPGEMTWRVPSLALAGPGLTPEDAVAASEAARLFVARARLVYPDFAPTPRQAAAVIEVCRRLDGIPLAIELAAARLRVLTVEQLADRLDDCLRLLTGGGRATPPRHRTLRTTLDWSYGLLEEPARALLRQVAVFADGWTLTAAEAVCGDSGLGGGGWEETVLQPPAMLDLLTQLVDHSLVRVETSAIEARYRLLEPVRQYAAEKLASHGEAEATGRRHAASYLALAEQAEAELFSPRQQLWLARLGAEHANMRVALRWAVEHDEIGLGLRLAGAMRRYWEMCGYLREGQRWLADLLARADDGVPDLSRAKALYGLGILTYRQGEYHQAETILADSLALWRSVPDARGTALTLLALGKAAEEQRAYRRAREALEESLALLRDLDDRDAICNVLITLGNVLDGQGDLAAARALHDEALVRARAVGNRYHEGTCLLNLACLARRQADLEAALAHGLAGLHLFQELNGRPPLAIGLGIVAMVARGRGQAERAARLFGAAEAAHEAIGSQFAPASGALFAPDIAAARNQLGPGAFMTAWAAGRALSLTAAIAEADAAAGAPLGAEGPTATPAPPGPPAGLSAREVEVLRLVAAGRSNGEIAAALSISPNTVLRHVSHIFDKTGAANRAEAAVFAVRHDLAG